MDDARKIRTELEINAQHFTEQNRIGWNYRVGVGIVDGCKADEAFIESAQPVRQAAAALYR